MSAPFLMALLAFLLAAAIGMPVALAMMLSGIGYLLATGQDIGLASEQILNGLYNSYVLLAVPLFIFAANIMNAGGLSDRLLAFCLTVTGRLRGGLAQVNIVASVIFSGMSGSALADAAGVGKLVISMMVRSGHYTPGFAAAVTAASATIGPIIPPSIPMVLYALVSGTSVGYLFLGGVLPGLLMAGALMAVVGVIAHKRALPRHERVAIVRIPGITLRALPVLMLPVILLGSIYGGVTTPTEAAALACNYRVSNAWRAGPRASTARVVAHDGNHCSGGWRRLFVQLCRGRGARATSLRRMGRYAKRVAYRVLAGCESVFSSFWLLSRCDDHAARTSALIDPVL